MIVFFEHKKPTVFIPNAENKDRTSAFLVRNLNLSFFIEKKNNSHYGNESTAQNSEHVDKEHARKQTSNKQFEMLLHNISSLTLRVWRPLRDTASGEGLYVHTYVK
jgi:hypothetical protein